MLGIRLRAGRRREISTGSGTATAYSHVVRIELPEYRLSTNQFRGDFLPGLTVPLLGVANFLNRFVLTIDYPRRRFSLREPAARPERRSRRRRRGAER
jgi:hypothetical protein